MKKIIYAVTLIFTLHSFTSNVNAQSEMSDFLKTGVDDANKLINAYGSPLMKSFGAGLNAGWFNSAKVHGAGGFSITVSPNITFAPKADQTYNFDQLGLTNFQRINGNPESSTMFGSSDNGPEIGIKGPSPYTNNDTVLSSMTLPGGIGTNIFAVPTAQLAVGVGFGTEVAVRFLPQITAGDVKIGMWGFAVKHDFKQWIPAIKDMPFDLSAMFGYTSLSANFDMGQNGLKADGPSSTTYNSNPGKTYAQKIDFTSSGYTFNVLISKKISVFTPYLGLGYQGATSSIKMNGEFPITDINPNFDHTYGGGSYDPNNIDHHPQYVKELKDPVSLEGKIGGLRATAGFRLKLGPITLHGDYTFAEYNIASIGLGLHIQSIVPFKL